MTSFAESVKQTYSKVIRTRDDLHDYQDGERGMVRFMMDNPFSALFVDLGFGKTVSTLTLISDLLDKLAFNRVLIVGPLKVVNQTWPSEIPLWHHTAHLSHTLIRDDQLAETIRVAGHKVHQEQKAIALREAVDVAGLEPEWEAEEIADRVKAHMMMARPLIQKARRKASIMAIREATLRNPACIHLINQEQIPMLVEAWGKAWPYDVVIIDEFSGFKDWSTKRFKALKRLRRAGMIKRLHGLTASPTAEGYEGLLAMVYLLDLGKRLGTTKENYHARYFYKDYKGYDWLLKDGAAEKIVEKIADICLEIKKPAEAVRPHIGNRYVELTPDQMRAYKKFERTSVLELKDGEEISMLAKAGALAGKLLQYCSGNVYDEEKAVRHIHDAKIEELRQIIAEANGQPIIIAYWFKSSLASLVKAFPDMIVMDTRATCVDAWNAGKIGKLALHPQGASHGLNLQFGGHLMYFFDTVRSYEKYSQTIGRIDRQGQEYPVTVGRLVVRGTYEEDAMTDLDNKEDVQNSFFRLLKQVRSENDM